MASKPRPTAQLRSLPLITPGSINPTPAFGVSTDANSSNLPKPPVQTSSQQVDPNTAAIKPQSTMPIVIQAQSAKDEAARLEAERLEAERLEAKRLEAERLEAERLKAEAAASAAAATGGSGVGGLGPGPVLGSGVSVGPTTPFKVLSTNWLRQPRVITTRCAKCHGLYNKHGTRIYGECRHHGLGLGQYQPTGTTPAATNQQNVTHNEPLKTPGGIVVGYYPTTHPKPTPPRPRVIDATNSTQEYQPLSNDTVYIRYESLNGDVAPLRMAHACCNRPICSDPDDERESACWVGYHSETVSMDNCMANLWQFDHTETNKIDYTVPDAWTISKKTDENAVMKLCKKYDDVHVYIKKEIKYNHAIGHKFEPVVNGSHVLSLWQKPDSYKFEMDDIKKPLLGQITSSLINPNPNATYSTHPTTIPYTSENIKKAKHIAMKHEFFDKLLASYDINCVQYPTWYRAQKDTAGTVIGKKLSFEKCIFELVPWCEIGKLEEILKLELDSSEYDSGVAKLRHSLQTQTTTETQNRVTNSDVKFP